MDHTQLPSISFEDLVLGIHREMQFWRLPEDRVTAVLALTQQTHGEKPATHLRTFFPDDGPGQEHEDVLFQHSFFYPYILQILKNQTFWVDNARGGEPDTGLPDWLAKANPDRYFLFPVPVVATPVVFLVLAPGTGWSGQVEGLCKSVLHMADRLTSLHLAANLLGAFMPAVLSGIREERDLIKLFAARIAQLLMPARYQMNISGRIEDDQWTVYSNVPRPEEAFKVHLRQKVFLLYNLATLKARTASEEAFSGSILKINARKEHLRVLMERSYEYIYACWESTTRADLNVLQSARELTQTLVALRYELDRKTQATDMLIDRLSLKLNGIGHRNDNAFYRASFGWMVFYKQQLISISSDQEDGLTCIHHLLAHPDEQFSIDAMVQVVQQFSRRKTKNRSPQKNGEPDTALLEEAEVETIFSQRGYQFSAQKIWEQEGINPYIEEELKNGLVAFERKETDSFTPEKFDETSTATKKNMAFRRLYALVGQYFIIGCLLQRFGKKAYEPKLPDVNKKINALTLYLREDPEMNPHPDALEFFEDIRVDMYGDQSVASVSKPKEERLKAYQNINKAIDRAIDSIESVEMQDYLRAHIEKGDRCCYRPGNEKISWTTEL